MYLIICTFSNSFRDPPSLLCWSVCVNLTHNRLIWEEGTLVEKLPPSDAPVDKAVGVFSWFIIDWGWEENWGGGPGWDG